MPLVSCPRPLSTRYPRLLAGVYLSRALDMHLLLFHEMVQAEPPTESNKIRRGDADRLGTGTSPPLAKHPKGTPSFADNHGGTGSSSLKPAGEEDQDEKTGQDGTHAGGSNDLADGGEADMGSSPIGGGTEGAGGTGGMGSGGEGGRGLEGTGGGGYIGEGSGGSEGRSPSSATGKNGRFATSGRVREFRDVLKGVAAHASKMKVFGASSTFPACTTNI